MGISVRIIASVTALSLIMSPLGYAAYLPVTVEESDGSPSAASVRKLKVSNGTLTDDGSGTITLNTLGTATGWTDGGANVYATTVGDSVGIGTTAPSSKLDIEGAAPQFEISGSDARYIRLLHTGGTKYNFLFGAQQNVDNGFEITPSTAAGGTTFSAPSLLVAGATGNVGIGTTAPSAKFHVAQGTLTDPALGFLHSATWNDVNDSFIGHDISITNTASEPGNSYMFRLRAGPAGTTNILTVRPDGWTRLAGSLLVTGNPNTADANGDITVDATGTAVYANLNFTNDGVATGAVTGYPGINFYTVQGAGSHHLFGTGGGYQVRVSDTASATRQLTLTGAPDGGNPTISTTAGNLAITPITNFSNNVGIGSASPGYKLDVVGDINLTGSLRVAGVVQTLGSQWTTVAGPEIHYANNVGIGTTNPNGPLEVSATDGKHILLAEGAQTNYGEIGYGYNVGNKASVWLGVNLNSTSLTPAQSDTANASWYTKLNANADTFTINRIAPAGADSNFLTIDNTGKVGIATNAPDAPLHAVGGTAMTAGWNRTMTLDATYPSLVFKSNNSKWATIQYDYSSALNFRVGATSNDVVGSGVNAISIGATTGNVNIGSNALYVANGGNVGVGTTAPSIAYGNKILTIGGANTPELEFSSTATAGGNLGNVVFTNGTATTGGAAVIRGNLDASSTTNAHLTFHTGNNLTTSTVPAERMRIDSAGNVGIGTTNPGSILDVQAAAPVANLQATTGTNAAYHKITNTGGSLYLGTESSAGGAIVTGTTLYSGVLGTSGARALQLATNNSVAMTILSGGNVGIGSAAPGTKLDVNGTVNATAFTVAGSPLSGSQWTTQAGPEITYANNVGIGTTDPVVPLDVRGIVQSGGLGTAGQFRVYANSGTGTGSYGIIQMDNTNLGRMIITNGNGNQSTENSLQISSSTFPGVDDTYALGTAAYRWNYLKVGTGVSSFAGNVGIGTTVPEGKLDVLGASAAVGDGAEIMSVRESTGTTRLNFGVVNQNYAWVDVLKSGVGRYNLALLPSGGNVGIGTTTPVSKLHIKSPAETVATGFAANLYLSSDDSMAIDKGGTMELGGQVTGTSAQGIFGKVYGFKENGNAGDTAGYIGFATHNNTNLTEKVRITGAGNVGIGSVTPGYKLDVTGDVNISGTYRVNGTPLGSSSGGWTDGGANVYTTTSTDFVGIGTSTPSQLLTAYSAASHAVIQAQAASTGNFTAGFQMTGGSTNAGWTIGTNRADITTAQDSLWFYKMSGSAGPKMVITDAGNIGIGSIAPARALDIVSANPAPLQVTVSGNGNSGIVLNQSGTGGQAWIPISTGSGDVQGAGHFGIFDSPGGVYRMVIKNTTGNVGIGTITPNLSSYSKALTFYSGTAGDHAGVEIVGNRGAASQPVGSLSFHNLQSTAATDRIAVITAQVGADNDVDSGALLFQTSDSANALQSRMIIEETGEVGIGTTAPTRMLEVTAAASVPAQFNTGGSANGGIFLNQTGTNGQNWGLLTTGSGDANGAGHFGLYDLTGGVYRLMVRSTGNVGIGSANPGYKLDVTGDVNISGTYRVNGTPIGGSASGWTDGGTNVYNTTLTDLVGIGTSTPGALLHVNQSQNGNTAIIVSNLNAGAVASALTYMQSDAGYLYNFATSSAYTTSGLFAANRAYVDANISDGIWVGSRHASGGLHLFTGGTTAANERLTITSAGLVGIGTTSPGGQFHVSKDQNANTIQLTSNLTAGTAATAGKWLQSDAGYLFNFVTSSAYTTSGIYVANSSYVDSSTTGGLYLGARHASGAMHLFTGGTAAANERMTILSGGNVGIGTTAPIDKLHVAGAIHTSGGAAASTGSEAFFDYTGGNTGRIQVMGPDTSTNGAFQIQTYRSNATNSLIPFYISAAGNVGIGTTNPDSKLHILPSGAFTTNSHGINVNNTATNVTTDSISKTGIYINSSGSFTGSGGGATNNYGLYVDTVSGADNNYAAVFASGNVGIGTTNPGNRLHVYGTVAGHLDARIQNSDASGYSTLWLGSVNEGIIRGGSSAAAFTNQLALVTGANSIVIAPNSAVAMTLLSGGNVGIGSVTPGYKLDVTGDVNISGTYRVNGSPIGAAASGWTDGGAVIYNTTAGDNVAIGATTVTAGGGFIPKLGLQATYPAIMFDSTTAAKKWGIGNDSAGSLDFFDSTSDAYTTRMRIFTNGYVAIGTTAALGKLHVVGNNGASNLNYMDAYGAGTQAGIWARAARGTAASPTVVAANDIMWDLRAHGHDGTDFEVGAVIRAAIDGTPGNDDMPGRLGFFTTPDGTITPLERLRIDNAGNVGIGTTTIGTRLLVVSADNTTAGIVKASSLDLSAATELWYSGLRINGSNASQSLQLDGKGTGHVLLNTTATGSVGIADTTPDHMLDVAGNIGLDASGYVNFGDTDGTSGYGFRDNGGTLQLKNSGGAWTNIPTSGTSQWTTTGSDIYYNTGGVSIGTTAAPLGKLQLVGGPVRDGGWHSSLEISPSGSGNYPSLYFSGQESDRYSAIQWTKSTSGNTANLVRAQINISNNSTTNSDLSIYTNNAVGTSNAVERMRILGDGKVGIGTTAPSALLDVRTSSASSFPLIVKGDIDNNGGYTGIKFSYEGSANTHEKAAIMVRGTTGSVQPEMHFLLDNTGDSSNADINDARLSLLPSGNVGIGSASPQAKLDVTTGIRVNSSGTVVSSFADGVNMGTWDALGYDSSGVRVALGGYRASQFSQVGLYTSGTEKLRIDTNGNVSIGTTTAVGKLHVQGGDVRDAGWHSALEITPSGTGNYPSLYFAGQDSDRYSGIIWTKSLSGNTANQVRGLISIANNTTTNSDLAFYTNNAVGTSAHTEKMRILGDGKVGIGTTTPNTNLTIYNPNESTTLTNFTQALTNGGINIVTDYTDGAHTSGIFWSTQDNNATKPKAGVYMKETGGGTYLYFGTSGNYATGITTSPYIDTTGAFNAPAYYHTSDARLKSNIITSPGLSMIDKIRGVTFDWKDTGGHSAGILAQDVEKVLPEAVSTDPETGMKSVNYGALTAPIIESIKELKKDSDAKDKRIAELESRIEELSKRMK